MDRLRARAPRGERAYGKVPRKRGRNQTLIASITLEGAVGEALSAFTPQDAAGWFAHCGYQPLDQPL